MTSRRVLVVDDDEAIREIAAVSMRAVGGHDVQTAASGAEALLLAAAQPPEVILLDVIMPELDGPTTALRLQDDERSRGSDFLCARR